MPVSVRQATATDLNMVSSILVEAETWVSARGTPMWMQDELSPERLASDVRDGLFFLAEWDGTPAGTIKFQLSDLEFWPDAAEGESAYIHRLAVRRQFAGRGVSTALMSWAAERAASLGRPLLRLDCDAGRAKLRALYERVGFRYHSDRQVGPYFVARYELRVTDNR